MLHEGYDEKNVIAANGTVVINDVVCSAFGPSCAVLVTDRREKVLVKYYILIYKNVEFTLNVLLGRYVPLFFLLEEKVLYFLYVVLLHGSTSLPRKYAEVLFQV